MKEINVTVIGSGSTYCPELIYGFIEAKDSLKLKRVAFMDIDERKRTIVGGLCVRMLKSAGIDCEVVMTDDLDLALQGADFVVNLDFSVLNYNLCVTAGLNCVAELEKCIKTDKISLNALLNNGLFFYF